ARFVCWFKSWFKWPDRQTEGLLALLVVAYLPTVIYDYVPPDQWRAFRYSVLETSASARCRATTRMLPPLYIRTGRPLVWIGEAIEHTVVNKISDFTLLRPICLLVACWS